MGFLKMKYLGFLVIILIASNTGLASIITCEGWYQKPGVTLQRASMEIESSTANNSIYAVNQLESLES